MKLFFVVAVGLLLSGCDFYCYYGASRSVIGSVKYSWSGFRSA